MSFRTESFSGIESLDKVMTANYTAVNSYAVNYETVEKLLKAGYAILAQYEKISDQHDERHYMYLQLPEGIILKF